MISWRTIFSVLSCTLLYAVFLWEASPNVKPLLSPPAAKFQSKVAQNEISMNTFGGAMAPFTADHPLLTVRGLGKRDVCNDTWPGRYEQTCLPSRTLCCIIPGAKLPACNAIGDWGACCTESGDCYVDVTSNCNTGSSSCGNGVCCPDQTSCLSNFNYTQGRLARCSVNKNLRPGSSSSSSSSSAITTATSTGTSTVSSATGTTTTTTSAATTTSSNPPPPANRQSDDGALTAGQAAGIAIGSIAVAGLLGVAFFMLWRRRRGDKNPKQPKTASPQSQFTPQQAQFSPQHGPFTPQYAHYPQELANEAQLHEAPNDDRYYIDQYGRRQPYKLTYAQHGVPLREMQ